MATLSICDDHTVVTMFIYAFDLYTLSCITMSICQHCDVC